ncbi:MAG: glycosyltransferase family 2 protein [Actinomycetota bacterium]|nr:glycosyltransferase family 2 protein [Actinomycetota bacterium]
MPARALSDQVGRESAVRGREREGGPGADLSVTVVIPSLAGGSALVRLVRSLTLATGSLEVIVADNGLPEDTRSALEATDAEVVPMGRNLGFGAAVNRAAWRSHADVLVVLNDDIEPLPGFLDALVAPIAGGADMVAGVLVQERAPARIETAGVELDRTLAGPDYLHDEPVARLEQPLPPPFAPSGGAGAYRLPAFRKVGGFDENLFAYFEDVDLAIRLRAGGATCALAPRARALHVGSGTLGYRSLAKANLVGFSRGYLLRKYRVLRGLRSGPAALAVETVAVLLLARQHRSLGPGVARVRGWRRCDTRLAPPPRSDITVTLADAWRRRYVRSRMPSSTAAS